MQITILTVQIHKEHVSRKPIIKELFQLTGNNDRVIVIRNFII